MSLAANGIRLIGPYANLIDALRSGHSTRHMMSFFGRINERRGRNALHRSRSLLPACVPLAMLTALAGACAAQVSGSGPAGNGPLICTSAAEARNIRLGGLTELIGDIVLTCTGGPRLTPGAAIPTANIAVSLNATVTNRIVATGAVVDSLLLIDEPGSGLPAVVPGFGPDAPRIPCIAGDGLTVGAGAGGCTEFAGAGPIPTAVFAPGAARPGPNLFIGTASGNQVTFHGIPILPPAGSTRIFRITNIRANVAGLRGTGSGPPQALASIAISPNASLPVSNPVLTAGFVTAALSTSIRNAGNSDSLSGGGANFAQCNSATMVPAAMLQFSELFGTAFKTRVVPTATPNGQAYGQQSGPGPIGSSESGFVTYDFGTPVGLADHGTRLKAVFDSVPPGIHLFVSVTNLAADTNSATMSQPLPTSTSSFARLVSGEAVPDGNGTVPAVNPTAALNGSPGITDIAEIPVINGTAMAVWEVINTNPSALETLLFGLWIDYSSDPASGSPPPGTATARLSFAPTPGPLTFSGAAAEGASATLPLPRFLDASQGSGGLFTISGCQTTLLFPYVTNQTGFDTALAIANTSQDPFSTRAQSGSCVLNWYDGTSHLPTNTESIAAGTVYTGTASSLVTNGFTGYVIARCGFSFAHGFAYVGDLGLRNLAIGYLALIMGSQSPRSQVGSGEALHR